MATIEVRSADGRQFEIDDRDLPGINDRLRGAGQQPLSVLKAGPPEAHWPGASEQQEQPKPGLGERILSGIGKGVEHGTNALIGAIHGAASGPLTGRVLKPFAGKSYDNMLNETELAQKRDPVSTMSGQVAGSFVSPESIAGGKLMGVAGGKLKEAAFLKELEKAGGGVDALPDVAKALTPGAAWNIIRPGLGAAAGYKAGEAVDHPYLGALAGAAMAAPTGGMSGKSSLFGLHHLLTDPLNSPITRYQFGRVMPQIGRLAGALPGPDKEKE